MNYRHKDVFLLAYKRICDEVNITYTRYYCTVKEYFLNIFISCV